MFLPVSILVQERSYLLISPELMFPIPCVQSSDQLDAAFKLLSSYGEQPVDWSKLEEAAGIGVVVSIDRPAVSDLADPDMKPEYSICAMSR